MVTGDHPDAWVYAGEDSSGVRQIEVWPHTPAVQQMRERLVTDFDLGVLRLANGFSRRPRYIRWAVAHILRYSYSLWYAFFGSLEASGDAVAGIARGLALVIVDAGMDDEGGAVVVEEHDAVDATVVGITGSYGKTSTKFAVMRIIVPIRW